MRPNWEPHAWTCSATTAPKAYGKGGQQRKQSSQLCTRSSEESCCIETHQDSCWGKRAVSTQDSSCRKPGLVADSQVALCQKAEWHGGCISASWRHRERVGALESSSSRTEYSTDKSCWLELFPQCQEDLPMSWKIVVTEQTMRKLIHWMIWVLTKPVILLPLDVNCIVLLKLDAVFRHIWHCPPPPRYSEVFRTLCSENRESEHTAVCTSSMSVCSTHQAYLLSAS